MQMLLCKLKSFTLHVAHDESTNLAETGFLRRLITAVRETCAPDVRTAVVLILCLQAVAYGHGTFHEMIDELAPVIAATPDDPALYARRALLYLEHGEWQATLADVELAVRKGAKREDLDLLAGNALAAGGKAKAAKELLDSFIKAHPDYAPALLSRARVFRTLNRQDDALADYRSAFAAMKEPEPDFYIELAETLVSAERPDAAINLLSDGIKRLGNVPQLVLKALELEAGGGKFDDALKRVDAMQQQAPRPEPWMAKRAALLAQAGRTEDARSAWGALRDHILALPNLERGSHAMNVILEEAQRALAPAVGSSTSSSTITSARPKS